LRKLISSLRTAERDKSAKRTAAANASTSPNAPILIQRLSMPRLLSNES
jgi:hypothetical protein